MKITLFSVGKLKEHYYKDAILEYTKRLSKYCKLVMVEVLDEKTIEQASKAQEDIIKEKEAERLLKNIRSDMFLIVLAIEGKRVTSIQFSEIIENLGIQGKSHIAFVIGGSMGLHSSIYEKADMLVSFSDMTFPHQLMRVILLEQIYRSFKIISREPYHK